MEFQHRSAVFAEVGWSPIVLSPFASEHTHKPYGHACCRRCMPQVSLFWESPQRGRVCVCVTTRLLDNVGSRVAFSTVWVACLKDKGRDRTGQDSGQDRTGQDRTGEGRRQDREQDRGHESTGQDRTGWGTGYDTTEDRTGQDRGHDRTDHDRTRQR